MTNLHMYDIIPVLRKFNIGSAIDGLRDLRRHQKVGKWVKLRCHATVGQCPAR